MSETSDKTKPSYDLIVQSYFEARSVIKELESRQHSTIHFYLGSFAALATGGTGLLQYVDIPDRPFIVLALLIISSILAAGLYFSWCSITLMINRAATYCVYLAKTYIDKTEHCTWESWLRSANNKAPVPYLIESSFIIFLTPVFLASLFGLYFLIKSNEYVLFGGLTVVISILFLIIEYTFVLKSVKKAWSLN